MCLLVGVNDLVCVCVCVCRMCPFSAAGTYKCATQVGLGGVWLADNALSFLVSGRAFLYIFGCVLNTLVGTLAAVI